MTGPHDSIIGVTIEAALGRFLNGMPARFESATRPGRLNAVIVTADLASGKATAIERLNLSAQDVDALAAHRRRWTLSDGGSRSTCRSKKTNRERRAARRRPSGASTPSAELTAGIRGLLETRFGEIWVEGEISNCKVWNTGHMYFTLKDGGAQIKAVMFRTQVRYLQFKPEDGLHVVARGRLGVYEPKGEYQIVCEHMEPHGLGALQLAFEQLKKKLQAEGLFDPARKRPLPALPRRIGIVTSLDGAALRDILKVLRRRAPECAAC